MTHIYIYLIIYRLVVINNGLLIIASSSYWLVLFHIILNIMYNNNYNCIELGKEMKRKEKSLYYTMLLYAAYHIGIPT